jgi:two-component system, cell cycle sensor histidine kinase and response regulator CckA
MNIEAWYSRVHPDDHARIGRSLRTALDEGAEVWSDEYRFRRADGNYATIFDRGFVLRNADGAPVRMIGAMMDVSDRKQLEAQFRQAQKLEAVGQLAGGVAHDFNNILTVIQGHASLVLETQPVSEVLRDSVRQILDVSERAAALTRQLLAFSRKQVLQTVDLDLNAAVSSMTRLLQRILGEDIRLVVQPSEHAAMVRADPSMMEQVILNLAVNARDAMTAGGTLTIRTTLENLDEDSVPPDVDTDSVRFVRVSINDTGCGIPEDVMPHIFEPFFSTKGIERGSGLGLATVYGVVKQHRGWLTVRSDVGKGTTFDIYLPVSDAQFATPQLTPGQASAPGGQETILIVEDEPSVRLLARRLLERRGYRVLEAANGPAAMTQWHEHRGVIDAVLTDMVMPDGMSGLDLANQLLDMNPRLKVIVTSGYSVDLGGQDISKTTHISFLAKPYSAPQLESAVRASLNK